MRAKNPYSSGFTLLELMITVAILAIIAAIAIPAYSGYILSSRRAECLNELAAIKLAEEEFFLANNRYFDGTLNEELSEFSLRDNSAGLYTPSPEALGVNRPSNCNYSVVVPPAGNAYTLTVTGMNDLATEGVIEVYVSQ